MSESKKDRNVVNVGDHIIIQRKNHLKIHKMTSSNTAMLGKDKIRTSEIIGKPYWTTFKMESVKKGEFNLTECSDLEEISAHLIKDSGEDNRNICDDGSSQMLSKQEIIGLRDSGLSSNEILGQIVENSKTFMNKTEFSQKKYIKKKEKKYFDYITIRKPTIRLITSILHTLDPSKLLGLRVDTISQLPTAIDMHSNGTYILYESGCQGIVTATLLNCLSEGGKLFHLHPGYTPQKQAVSAMNFEEQQIERLLSVNIQSLLRALSQDPVAADDGPPPAPCSSIDDKNTMKKNDELFTRNDDSMICELDSTSNEAEGSGINERKRKLEESNNDNLNNKKIKVQNEEMGIVPKKAQWQFRTDKVASLLKQKNADGLVIVAKEYPINIVDTLLPFIGKSKPFIIYNPYREVLQELYIHLKSKHNVVDLWMTSTWMRDHQILPERTHPDVMMSGSGGYLLTGIVVE